jgi:hypothetical protein
LKVSIVPVDSEVFGANVLAIDDFSAADFERAEAEYVAAHRPVYASCKVPLERLADIHALQRNGFELVECQIRSSIDLRREWDTSAYPYRFAEVTNRVDLEAVLEIARTTFVHDRFSIDPRVDRQVSGRRYCRYVEQSFAAGNESVYRLYDPATDRTVAFKTHRLLENGEVLFLLGGVDPKSQRLGLGVINSYWEFNTLRSKGFVRGYTHISAANHHVFNVEIGKLGFRVLATYAVMRKIYARVAPT